MNINLDVDNYDFLNLTEKDTEALNHLEKLDIRGRRAFNIFQFLLLNKDFKKFVKTKRTELNIPQGGYLFSNEQDKKTAIDKWLHDAYYDYNSIVLQRFYLGKKIKNYTKPQSTLQFKV